MQNWFHSTHFSSKLICIAIGLLLFFSPLQAIQEPSPALQKAEKLFAERLYGDALPLYSLLLSGDSKDEQDLRAQLTLRLITCCLQEKNATMALSLSTPLKTGIYQNNALYLMSLAYRQLQQPAQALALLNQIASMQNDTVFESFVELEKGFHHFQLGDYTHAEAAFKRVQLQQDNPLPYLLAQLQLAKIYLITPQRERAQEILFCSQYQLPSQHPLSQERIYLTGLLFLEEGHENQAAHCFEQLIPKLLSSANKDSAIPVLKNLAVSYLRQALAGQSSQDQTDILLSKAEMTLQKLIERDSSESSHALLWFVKGLKAFEEGLTCQKELQFDQMSVHLNQAAHAFAQSTALCQAKNSSETALALKYLALAYAYQPNSSNTQKAWDTLLTLLENPQYTHESIGEIHCLAGWAALRLPDKDIQKKAQSLLQEGRQRAPSSKWSPLSLKIEGLLSIHLGKWEQADALFEGLLNEESTPFHKGELWFWRAYCAEQKQQPELRKDYLQNVYTLDPTSPYAPSAFFHLYSYRDYMRGQRQAMKHLQAMPQLFPSHPLLITTHYLIGLDHKKDHITEEGQVLRRKDLTAAIEAFQLAETTFDALFDKKLIPSVELSYFIQVRYRAQLERAQANLTIAQHTQGGKKQIYLKYAEGVFQQLINDFAAPRPLIKLGQLNRIPYSKIWAEAELKLAQTYVEEGNEQEAENTLNASLNHYQESHTTQGYALMRVWMEKGKLDQSRKQHDKALICYHEAEQAAGDFLGISPDEKIDLWIQQSLCYKDLNQLDEAMLLLSKVINDDVISSLRIKAMFLRAEIYELQNRPELALKQLEATAQKGGEWALHAQKKLEQVYGY